MRFSLFSFTAFFLIFSFIFSFTNIEKKRLAKLQEEKRLKELKRYKKYSMKEIQSISKNITIDPRAVVRELNKMLNNFYLENISEKKIQYNLDISYDFFGSKLSKKKEWNVDLLRNYMKKLRNKPLKINKIKEAPNLYLMHYNIAKAYLKLKKEHPASFHFKMALRYRTLKMTEKVFLNKNRRNLLDSTDKEIKLTQKYSQTKLKLEQYKRELEEKKRKAIVLNDQILRQKTKNKKMIFNQLKKNREDINNILKQNKNISKDFTALKKEYNKISIEWNKESALFLYEMADLTKRIEEGIKERLKILNKKAIYKTSFNQTLIHDYSKNRKYTAYANILSMASKLDPSNPQILYKLGEEYRTSQNVRKAIYSFKQAILSNKSKTAKINLSDFAKGHIFLSLGGLYYRIKRYVDSALYYEKALKKLKKNLEQYKNELKKQKLQIAKESDFKKKLFLKNK